MNLVRALEELKTHNLWIIGLDECGQTDYDCFDLTGDCVLVLGREVAGLHDLVRRTCDHLLRIPMSGGVSSLNVSAAGAVVLYEAFRQRRNAERAASGARPDTSTGSRERPHSMVLPALGHSRGADREGGSRRDGALQVGKLRAGLDVNGRGVGGSTPLHLAAASENGYWSKQATTKTSLPRVSRTRESASSISG